MRFPLALAVLLLHIPMSSWGQANRSVIQAFNPSGLDQVLLDLPGNIEILEAPGELIQVETRVTLQNAADPILKALILAMRYKLGANREDMKLYIAPNTSWTPVTVRGVTLSEQIDFRVYLPKGIEAVMPAREPVSAPE